MNRILLLLSALLVSPCAHSGNVADIFAQDVFGAPWGSSIKTVTTALPDGKQETQLGMTTYTIKDGRKLFDIKRDPDNYIRYHFDAEGSMNGVGIQFPLDSADDYGTLLNKLNTYFGKAESVPNSFGAIYVRWPEDEGITISLTHIPGQLKLGELLFAIEYRPNPPSITREGLGF